MVRVTSPPSAARERGLGAVVIGDEIDRVAVGREARLGSVAVEGLSKDRDWPPLAGVTATWCVAYWKRWDRAG